MQCFDRRGLRDDKDVREMITALKLRDFMHAHRSNRWEDELALLLETEQVTLSATKRALKDERTTGEFFASRGKKPMAHAD